MYTVGIYLSEGFQLLDFAGPAAAFENAQGQLGCPAYRVAILSERGGAVRNSLGMACDTERLGAVALDTLMVIGGVPGPPPSASALAGLVQASARCQRVASVCIGAFTLRRVRCAGQSRFCGGNLALLTPSFLPLAADSGAFAFGVPLA